MIYKIILSLTFFYTFSFAEGLFDFFGGGEPTQGQSKTIDADINRNGGGQTFKENRENNLVEIIPYITYGYSKLEMEYENSTNNTEAIDSKFDFGVTINTAFNYFGKTPFGYMLNFNYESYNFDKDNKAGTVQTSITGSIFKAAPIVFYSFDVNNIAVYAGLGFGIAKYNLEGTNNYGEDIIMDDFSLLSLYKVELLYGKFIFTVLQENSSASGTSYSSDLDELHLSLGYIVSF